MSLPDWSLRRTLEFRTFDEALAEVDQLLAAPYERRGNWDLSQACDHLADTFEGSMRGFDFGAPWVIRGLIGKLALRYVLHFRSIPFRPRMPQRLNPQPGKDPAQSGTRLREKVREFEASRGPLAPHPFFGRVSVDQWRQIHLFHMAHHLGFLVPQQTVTAGIAPG